MNKRYKKKSVSKKLDKNHNHRLKKTRNRIRMMKGGYNDVMELKDIHLDFEDTAYCNKPCNPEKQTSVNFFKIQTNLKNIKKTIKEKPFIELFHNLIYGNSPAFYKNITDNYPQNIKLPSRNDFNTFINTVKSLKRFCVGIGTSDLLAPFALHLLDTVKQNIKSKEITEGNIEQEQQIIDIINDNGFIVSSMRKKYWNEDNNQDIIVDVLNDIPDVNAEAWGIKNGMLALIMPIPIHIEKTYNERKVLTLDLETALKNVGCRVTRDEICLVYTFLNGNEEKYTIKCGRLMKDFWIYFIYKK